MDGLIPVLLQAVYIGVADLIGNRKLYVHRNFLAVDPAVVCTRRVASKHRVIVDIHCFLREIQVVG